MIFLTASSIKNFETCSCGKPLTTESPWCVLEGSTATGLRRLCPNCYGAQPEVSHLIDQLNADVAPPAPLGYGQYTAVIVGETKESLKQFYCAPQDCLGVPEPRQVEGCLLNLSSAICRVWCPKHRDQRVPADLGAFLHRVGGTSPYVEPPKPTPPPPTAEQLAAEREERWRMSVAKALAGDVRPGVGAEHIIAVIKEIICDAK